MAQETPASVRTLPARFTEFIIASNIACVRIACGGQVGALLHAIATHIVGHRPDRVEPRGIKRRPKGYKPLNQPRHILRISLPKEGI